MLRNCLSQRPLKRNWSLFSSFYKKLRTSACFSSPQPPPKYGHLDCFYLLTLGNSVAMKMGVQISLWEPTFCSLGYTLRNGILGLYGGSIFHFFRTLRSFPQWHTTLQSTSSIQEFQFLHILTNICYFFLRVSHFNHFKVYRSFRRNSLSQKSIGESL